MGKLSFGRVLDCFCLSSGSTSCFCINSLEAQDEFERKPLIVSDDDRQLVRLKDVIDEKQTLAFQLKPKMVVLRVSMHCNGCARKVEKHISKMEGESNAMILSSLFNINSIAFTCPCLTFHIYILVLY